MRAEDAAGATGPHAVLLGHTPGELWEQDEVLWAPRRDGHLLVVGDKGEAAEAALNVLVHAARNADLYESWYLDLRRLYEDDPRPTDEVVPVAAHRALSLERACGSMVSLCSAVDEVRGRLRNGGLRDRGELDADLADRGIEAERRVLVCVREAADFAPSVRDERWVFNAKQDFRRGLARVLEWGALTGFHVVATLTRNRGKNFVPEASKDEFTARLLAPGLSRGERLRLSGPRAASLSRTEGKKGLWSARHSGFFPEVEILRAGPAGGGGENLWIF